MAPQLEDRQPRRQCPFGQPDRPERCSMFREHLGVGAVDNYHLDAIRQPFDVRGQLETGTEVFIGNT